MCVCVVFDIRMLTAVVVDAFLKNLEDFRPGLLQTGAKVSKYLRHLPNLCVKICKDVAGSLNLFRMGPQGPSPPARRPDSAGFWGLPDGALWG